MRELLIDLVSTGSYQLVVNLDKVGFLDSAGLGYWSGAWGECGPTTARWIWSARSSGS
jgi:anti-anti-sigma regulatory factor